MTAPKVSVLIPTYNYARYLPEAIESILAQDYQNFELLISDDCSSDNSAEVIARYAAKDSRIRFQIHSENLGMVENWNWCLSQARGEYVKFIFGDDKLLSTTAIGQMVHLMESDPDISLAASGSHLIDEHSRTIETRDCFQPGVWDGKKIILRCLERPANLIGAPVFVMFRKRQAARGFDARYRQLVDLEMWFHLLEQGDLVYTPEELCCFRTHGAQQTAVNRASLIGHKELLMLFAKCSEQPWYSESSAMMRLNMLRSIRKLRNVCPRAEYKVFDKRVRERVPKPLFYAYWIAHRIYRPFENTTLSLRKRWLRLKQRGETSVKTPR